jgi:hypothetical protein
MSNEPPPSAPTSAEPSSLDVMRRVLAKASLGLEVREGSLAHEELAARILDLFELHDNAEMVLAAALEGRKPAMQGGSDELR